MMKLSAIVLTRNEELNIKNCLSVLNWADEILVIDSGSTDRTKELARETGARVIEHPFTDFAEQRNFALTQAAGDWVLFIDADERMTSSLADEIRGAIEGYNTACVYALPRHTYFFGKRLRFGDAREDAPVRLFPRSQAQWSQPVHEKIKTDLLTRKLTNPLLHYSTRNLAHYFQKVDSYVPLEIATMKNKGLRPSILKVIFMPTAKFLFLYVIKLGILDGVTGFQYAILSAYYAFIKQWRYLWAKRA